MLVLSFLALGTLWRRPQLERRAAGRPLPAGLERVLRSTRCASLLGAVSAGLLVLVFLTALVGEPSSAVNLAPTFVYVIFWLGLVPVQVLLGNVWPALNPWLAVANARRLGWRTARADVGAARWPTRSGSASGPAAVLLFCFAALELCYAEPGEPARAGARGRALQLRDLVRDGGLRPARRGPSTARRFTVYFGLLALISPFGERDGRLVVRTPLSGLAGAATTGRGCSRSSRSCSARSASTASAARRSGRTCAPTSRARTSSTHPGRPSSSSTALALAGLLGCVLLVAIAYLGATRVARRVVGERPLVEPEFLLSLVPIALVYAVAHYFTLLLVQGQFALRLASDPFGYGWDLFGTADFAPNSAPISPNTVWYVQVGVARHRPRRRARGRARPCGRASSRRATRCARSTRCSR